MIPVPQGLEIRPYQRTGVQFLDQHRGALLADDMGLGKTIQVICAINCDSLIKRTLIVCPAVVKIHWARELRKWGTRGIEPFVISGTKRSSLPDFCGLTEYAAIINYEILRAHRSWIFAEPWDLLVCDESHKLKNPKALCTAIVCGTDKRKKYISAKRKWFLTGTPIFNRVKDLWTTLSTIAPDQFNDFWAFVHEFCDAHQTPFGLEYNGASNLPTLRKKLSNIMLRRMKEDVEQDLPKVMRQVISFSSPSSGVKLMLRRNLFEPKEAPLTEVRLEIERIKAGISGIDPLDAELREYALMQEVRASVRAEFETMSSVRLATGLEKVPFIVSHLVDTPSKVVCFLHHRAVIEQVMDGLEEEGISCVVVDGGTSLAARQKAIDAFQNEAEPRIILCGLNAAGSGITLTAASHVVFGELDFLASTMNQAADRVNRIGQKAKSILLQYLVFSGSLEERMIEMLIEKNQTSNAVYSGDDCIILDLRHTERSVCASIPVQEFLEASTIDPVDAEGFRKLGILASSVRKNTNQIDATLAHEIWDHVNKSPQANKYAHHLLEHYSSL